MSLCRAGGRTGIGVGQSDFRDADSQFNAIAAAARTTVSTDDTDTAWKAFVGYRFHRNFAAEIGYVDLGKATGSFGGGAATVESKAKGLTLDVLGILPVANNFDLFAKVGTIDAKVETSASNAFGGFAAASDTSWKANYGIGAAYNFNHSWAIRAEYERFNNLGDNATTGESNVDLASVSAVYKF